MAFAQLSRDLFEEEAVHSRRRVATMHTHTHTHAHLNILHTTLYMHNVLLVEVVLYIMDEP